VIRVADRADALMIFRARLKNKGVQRAIWLFENCFGGLP
jgi:hypothetical protein